MGYLGIPYRVVFEAKAFQTGLNDVRAMVVKPDLSLSGPYVLNEFPSPLIGRYFFDYLTSTTDPEGEYIVTIVCQTQMFQTTDRISLYSASSNGVNPGGGGMSAADFEKLISGILAARVGLRGEAKSQSSLRGDVYRNSQAVGHVEADELESKVATNQEIEGEKK